MKALSGGVVIFLITSQLLFGQWRCIKGDCYEGYGECLFPDGARYEGQFLAGKINGLGALFFANGDLYSGEWSNQVRQGKGRLRFKSGDEYFGEFQQNYIQGKGKMTYANSNSYEGTWQANKPQGKGILIMNNQGRFEGYFVDGKFEGDGIFYYPDGSKYQGKWKANQRSGLGNFTSKEGIAQNGYWEKNQFVGVNALQVEQNKIPQSKDTEALRNCNVEFCDAGTGQYVYRNNARYEGQFLNGLPEGQGKTFYPNGDYYIGAWRKSNPHGRGIMYYADGHIMSAIWDNGKPITTFLEEKQPPVVANPRPVTASKDVKIWAVIVGAAQYVNMPTLHYSDDDAYHIYAFLKSPDGGALPESQMRLLIDEDATHNGILSAMNNTFQQADDNDVVFFYFSGHGIPGAFLPIDYDGYNNLLKHEEIRNIIESSRAKHKIVVADACHAGTFAEAREGSLTLLLEKYYQAFANTKGGMAILLSSKSQEYSLEDNGLRSGIFSHYLIKGIRGPADRNSDGIVTVKEEFDYVFRNVRLYTANAQTPILIGNFDDKMPFALVR
jgi:hypothetical protein